MSHAPSPSLPLLQAFVDAAPDAMVIVDRRGLIAYANAQAEALFGHPRGELAGQPVERLVPERFAGAHPGHREGYFHGPRTRPMGMIGMALFGRRRDGTEFPAEISLSPLETADGSYAITAIRDVTSRKQTEEALRQANEAARVANEELRSFASSVAHDLRAPLRSIRGFTEILLRDYHARLDARGQGYMKRIDAAAERMGLLIEALLTLSRVTQAELRRERVSLSALAHAIVAQLRASQPERAVEVVIDAELVATGDTQLLRVVLENLIGNAWKFTSARAAARIEVGATEGPGGRAFFVRDNGAGFDMIHAHKLFAPFERLHPATAFAGTGIGLATVQRAVKRHDGRIWAEAAVNEGATFFFTLRGAEGGAGS